jgi:hypothetical protein
MYAMTPKQPRWFFANLSAIKARMASADRIPYLEGSGPALAKPELWHHGGKATAQSLADGAKQGMGMYFTKNRGYARAYADIVAEHHEPSTVLSGHLKMQNVLDQGFVTASDRARLKRAADTMQFPQGKLSPEALARVTETQRQRAHSIINRLGVNNPSEAVGAYHPNEERSRIDMMTLGRYPDLFRRAGYDSLLHRHESVTDAATLRPFSKPAAGVDRTAVVSVLYPKRQFKRIRSQQVRPERPRGFRVIE